MAPSSDAPTFARAAPSAASFTAPVVSRRQATFKKPVVPALPLPYLQRHSTATSQARLRSADPTATTDLGGTSSRAAEQKVEPLLLPRIPRSPGEKDSLLSSAVDDSSDAKRNCQGPSAGGWELDAEEPTPPADVEASRHRNSLSSSTQDVPTDAPPSSSFRRSATSPPIHMPPRSLPNASASSTVPRGICHSPMHLVDSLEQPYGFTHRSNVHQHHPNNSGLVFGGFQDSNTSSPAPPNSRGAPPPPPNLSLPSISPMACTSEPPTVTDVVDQGALITAPAPANGRPPMINNFGPSTPHSFHGSQSSTCMDENSYNHLYLANGHNSLESELYSGISALPPARYPVSTTLPALEMDNREDILRTVRQGFANSEFADCELHLHIGESQPPEYLSSPSYRNPLLLAAHRLILARSPSLRNIMVAQGVPNGKVTVSSEDPFLRSDAFWFAVQTLYGYPLYEVHSDPSSADRTMDNFGLALGYAAAGHLLQLLPVIAQGIRDAVRLVNWTTLEKALEFAMAGATVLYPVGPKTPSSQQIIMPRYRHGPVVHELMAAIVAFLIDNFPRHFALDGTVSDPPHSRIPPTLPSLPRNSGHGSSVRLSLASRNLPQGSSNSRVTCDPRLSNIKFGDISPTKGNNDQAAAEYQVSDETTFILSRVLLNLPFDFVKLILESRGPDNILVWRTTEDRHRVISDVVAERERRRLEAVEAVRSGRVPNAEALRRRLASREPQMAGDVWDALGWMEEVCAENIDTPIMVRTWVPLD